jgi:two-component system sensor histidine kinase EvgS
MPPLLVVYADNPFEISEQLRELGMASICVADGASAIDAVRKQTFAIILMDCQMPVMDGYETTRRIRDLEASAGLPYQPIIAISASTDTVHREACMTSGMDGVLRKPPHIEELRSMLKLWLSDLPWPPDEFPSASATIDYEPLYRQALLLDADALQAAVGLADNDVAFHFAHRLKGAAFLADLPDIAHLAERMETMIRSGSPQRLLEARRIGAAIREAVTRLPGEANDSGNDKN